MNYENIIVYDLETSGIDTNTAQIVQVGAVCVDARRLEIIEGSEFDVLIKPLYGEECAKAGLQELTDGAINIHKKGHALLAEKGVTLETGMSNFVSYVNTHNNINNYDTPILKRDLARTGLSSPFHPSISIDVLQLMFLFFENDKNVTRLSADSLIRKHMGWKDKGESHDALGDVIMTAEVLIKSMRLIRKAVGTVKFENCFSV